MKGTSPPRLPQPPLALRVQAAAPAQAVAIQGLESQGRTGRAVREVFRYRVAGADR